MPFSAWAYPEGAPWGTANPEAAENCTSCHFDSDAVTESPSLTLEGLPERVSTGQTYPLTLTLDAPESVVVGFQVIAVAEDEDAGRFESSHSDQEAVGTAVRSTSVRRTQPAAWSFRWRAPQSPELTAVWLLVAATAGNDDGSPLGDVVHFRSFKLETGAH